MEKIKKIFYINWFFYIFFNSLFANLYCGLSKEAPLETKKESSKTGDDTNSSNKDKRELEFRKNFTDLIEQSIIKGDIIKLEPLILFTKLSESDFKKYLLISKNNILKTRENLNKKITAQELGQVTVGALSIFLASIGISSFCYLSWCYFIENDYKDFEIVKSAIYGLPPAVIILGVFGDKLITKFLYKKNREKQYNNALGVDYILDSNFHNKFKIKRELNEKR